MKVLAVAYKPLNQETISQNDENGLTLLGIWRSLMHPSRVPLLPLRSCTGFMWMCGF